MTVTAIQTQAPAAEWNEEQRALIKRTVAPDSTNDELAMFLHVATKAGLDPLQKQIWFVKRKQKVTKNGREEWEDRVTIQAGVDGLQARALRMPDCEGIQSAVVYAKDDFVFDKKAGEVVRHEGNPFGAQGEIVGAWAIVRRTGKTPFVALIRYSEYYDDRSFLWKNKPTVMIEKVARSTALRRAYPENFGGIYDPAEMGKDALVEPHEQPKVIEAEVVPALPAAGAVEAPRQTHPNVAAAAQVLETKAETPKSTPTPPYVAALWARAKKTYGKSASVKFAAAAADVFGDAPKHSSEWSVIECLDVEHTLFPATDVP